MSQTWDEQVPNHELFLQEVEERKPSRRVVFLPNVPQIVALKYRDGKAVGGVVMYGLVDGRIMLVSHEVANQIRTLGIRPRERFTICKQESRWGVWLGERRGFGVVRHG